MRLQKNGITVQVAKEHKMVTPIVRIEAEDSPQQYKDHETLQKHPPVGPVFYPYSR